MLRIVNILNEDKPKLYVASYSWDYWNNYSREIITLIYDVRIIKKHQGVITDSDSLSYVHNEVMENLAQQYNVPVKDVEITESIQFN